MMTWYCILLLFVSLFVLVCGPVSVFNYAPVCVLFVGLFVWCLGSLIVVLDNHNFRPLIGARLSSWVILVWHPGCCSVGAPDCYSFDPLIIARLGPWLILVWIPGWC